jgi:hypothetical protein
MNTSKDSKVTTSVRKSYSRPNLTIYGDITKITLQHAGSTFSDSGMNTMATSTV